MKINDKGLGMIKHFEDTGLNTKYSSSSIKHCNKCNMDKQRSSFNIDISSYDGRQSYCNPCQKQIRRIYVEKNPENNTTGEGKININFNTALPLQIMIKCLFNRKDYVRFANNLNNIRDWLLIIAI